MDNLCEFPDDDGHILCRREATLNVFVTETRHGRTGSYTQEVLRRECANHAAAETLRNTYTYTEVIPEDPRRSGWSL